MDFRPGDLVVVADRPSSGKYAGREGAVAVVKRTNPKTRLFRVGTKAVVQTVKGVERKIERAVFEERPLEPIFEVGVDFSRPDAKRPLMPQAWFYPSELAPVVARSVRRGPKTAEQPPSEAHTAR